MFCQRGVRIFSTCFVYVCMCVCVGGGGGGVGVRFSNSPSVKNINRLPLLLINDWSL